MGHGGGFLTIHMDRLHVQTLLLCYDRKWSVGVWAQGATNSGEHWGAFVERVVLSDEAMTLTIGTWNVKGLNSPQKRQKIWKYIIDHHLDVVAIQETHLARTEDNRFRQKHYPLIYRPSAQTKHRGVALLFRSSKNSNHYTSNTIRTAAGLWSRAV